MNKKIITILNNKEMAQNRLKYVSNILNHKKKNSFIKLIF